MYFPRIAHSSIATALVVFGSFAYAGVSTEQAAALKSKLTPFGAERAGNKAGTIPEWTGGLKDTVQNGHLPAKIYADEKPLFSVTPDNMATYAAQLSEGTRVMLKTLPGYRLDVYPTHRTVSAPQYIYDRTFANATNLRWDNRAIVGDFKGGIPFPIPKNDVEILYNAQYFWRGWSREMTVGTWIVAANGKRTLATAAVAREAYPLDWPSDRPDPWKGQVRLAGVIDTTAPAYQAGERTLGLTSGQLKDNATVWAYLAGQRRVRKTPSIQYDVPNPFSSGLTNYDDWDGFTGAEDRYNWKLVEKREMLVPYNNNALYHEQNLDKLLGANYVNPDYMRWELHRVWVLEGSLKEGARHVVPRRMLYIDEDSWRILMSDQWDAKGQFWKFLLMPTYTQPGIGQMHGANFIYNLQSRAYTVFNLPNGIEGGGYVFNKPFDPQIFTVQSLEALGVR